MTFSVAINDHALGVQLREILLRDRYEGVPAEPQRLRSLVADLCRQDPSLRSPLTHLVLSQAFRTALSQDPPLRAGAPTAARLRRELRVVFTAPLCRRLDSVLGGLLPVSPADGGGPAMARAASTVRATAADGGASGDTAEPVTVWARSPRARGIALASLLSGSVVLALAGLAFWSSDSRALRFSSPASLQAAGALSERPADLLTEGLGTGEPKEVGLAAAGSELAPAPSRAAERAEETDAARRTVETIYASLASGDLELTRSFLAGPALKSFRASSASNCRSVEVAELEELGHHGPSVVLDGVVSCRFSDGSLQKEARRFRVDTAQQPPRLIDARFDGIVSPRGTAPAERGLATR